MIGYLTRLGVALDEALNVALLNGQPEQTISYHAAVAEKDGKTWGCWLCWFLAKAVQPGHCAFQFTTDAEPTSAAMRAGVLLLLTAYGIWFEAHQVFLVIERHL